MALITWAQQKVAAKYKFTPVLTPDVVNHSYAEACGFRPRSEASQMYSIQVRIYEPFAQSLIRTARCVL